MPRRIDTFAVGIALPCIVSGSDRYAFDSAAGIFICDNTRDGSFFARPEHHYAHTHNNAGQDPGQNGQEYHIVICSLMIAWMIHLLNIHRPTVQFLIIHSLMIQIPVFSVIPLIRIRAVHSFGCIIHFQVLYSGYRLLPR